MVRYTITLLLGCFLISLGINFFFTMYHLLDGGIIGLGLIAHYVWNTPVGMTIIVVSIPIYIAAWFYYRPFFYNSLIGVIVSSLFIDWLSLYSPHLAVAGPLASAIIGGSLLGIGAGIMFRMDISTGGFDLLSQMIATKVPLNVGAIIVIFDMLAVVAGIPIVTKEEIILSTIAVISTGVLTIIVTSCPLPAILYPADKFPGKWNNH
ncbi:YitT family protein [Alkalicoccobacillus porphyridii]|uniref:YitT family protein n=1 Tax=Alkalicoccobacillus porphyridii TaxID=2597270 RepID=A0A553ZVL9_9BACI|nr:YitT family protein [Alkalicoccobacillus porphyridii]TSB45509.1 YitT family protein [Alkalicoccobacillus porphyridii]